MDSDILHRRDFSLLWFAVSFALTILFVKLSSLLAQYNLYFHWSDLLEKEIEEQTAATAFNVWTAVAVRFLIPAGVGLILGVSLPLTMRTSVVAGAFFGALFLVWPAFAYFDVVVGDQLVTYKEVFFFFYALELILFSTAAFAGFSLGVLLSPLMPKFAVTPGEIRVNIAKQILLPAAVALAGNFISNAAARDFVLQVLKAK